MSNSLFENITANRAFKRGYPNPDYTDADVDTARTDTVRTANEPAQCGVICLDIGHYERLVAKAAALDVLENDIRARIDSGEAALYNIVNDALVMSVTGLAGYAHKKEAEADANG